MRVMREFSKKDAPAIVKVLTEAFSNEIALGMRRSQPKQLIEFSKRPTVQTLVYENWESVIAGFITMAEESVEYPAQAHLVCARSLIRKSHNLSESE